MSRAYNTKRSHCPYCGKNLNHLYERWGTHRDRCPAYQQLMSDRAARRASTVPKQDPTGHHQVYNYTAKKVVARFNTLVEAEVEAARLNSLDDDYFIVRS
jgi:hypothetical protein